MAILRTNYNEKPRHRVQFLAFLRILCQCLHDDEVRELYLEWEESTRVNDNVIQLMSVYSARLHVT